jgi:hypothetical protein
MLASIKLQQAQRLKHGLEYAANPCTQMQIKRNVILRQEISADVQYAKSGVDPAYLALG